MAASDWVTYGYDLEHSWANRSEAEIGPASAARLTAGWQFPAGAPLSLPVTGGQLIYICTSTGVVHALEEQTGNLRWKLDLASFTRPAQAGRLGIAASPVLAEGLLYIGDMLARVWCLDAASGRLVWKSPVGETEAGDIIWSSPVVHAGVLYAAVSSYSEQVKRRGRIVTLDAQRGTVLSTTPSGEQQGVDIYGSAAVDPVLGRFYYATGSPPLEPQGLGHTGPVNSVLAHAIATSEVAWVFPASPQSGRYREYVTSVNIVRVTRAGKTEALTLIGVGRQDGRYVALDALTGKLRWQVVVGYDGEIWGDAATAEGMVFTGATIRPKGQSMGEVLAIDAATGRIVWVYQLPPPSEITTHITQANGVVFFGDGAGRLYVCDHRSGKLIARYDLPSPVARGVVVANGRVLVSVAAPENALLALVPTGGGM